MTEQEIRFAIAKHHGLDLKMFRFEFKPRVNDKMVYSPSYSTREEAEDMRVEEVQRWCSETSEVEEFDDIDEAPRWTSCLNAAQSLEFRLTDDNREDYWSHLAFICERDFRRTGDKRFRQSASATARQRAEAYLLTFGLYK